MRAVLRDPSRPTRGGASPTPGREQRRAIVADRYAYYADSFLPYFYNTDVFAPDRIGDVALRASFQVAAGSGPHATYACADAWLTDFRDDLSKIDVPTLVDHGTADRILRGSHNIGWTHPDEVNAGAPGLPRRHRRGRRRRATRGRVL